MEQQEVKNFSSFNKSLTIMGIFVNQSFDSCLLACVPFQQEKPPHKDAGAHLPRALLLDRSFLCSKQPVNWSPLDISKLPSL